MGCLLLHEAFRSQKLEGLGKFVQQLKKLDTMNGTLCSLQYGADDTDSSQPLLNNAAAECIIYFLQGVTDESEWLVLVELSVKASPDI